MRFRSIPTLLRTFYAVATLSSIGFPASLWSPLLARRTLLKSMPTFPFLGALFGTSSSSQSMSYPVQKNADEWRAVLSKGQCSMADRT